MLGVFEKSKGKQPKELKVPSVQRPESIKTRADIAQCYLTWKKDSDTAFYNFPNANFMALSQKDEPLVPRSFVAMDDIFCIFIGAFENYAEMRRFYGLPRMASEAMIVHAAYKVLRDRAPYPPDQVIKDFKGRFAFMLFDLKNFVLFLARDREGGVELHWGTAADGSLVCSDDPTIVVGVCGNCYTPFPPGCFFYGGNGLNSFDHPLHMVKATQHKDEEGNIRSVIFQVDLQSRVASIRRSGSGDNWAVTTITAENHKEK